jgi:DNA recombination protein Rad52
MFSEQQVRLLSAKLNERFVKAREQSGKALSYIEGWHAIAEANRIFGFDGWDRETVAAECIWQDPKRDPKVCAYAARVRIRVRARGTTICRDGSGVGQGTGATLGEAHESALKEAETDAMKRALATFGNQFGLALYDKEQNGVRRRPNGRGSAVGGVSWIVLSGTGARLSRHELPEQFCRALRELIENAVALHALERIWERNAGTVEHLRRAWPDLKTVNGTHYADVLQKLYEQKAERIRHLSALANPGNGASEHQPELPLSRGPKRLRDSDHLRYVATLPCLICARTPAQAHHLRFAQPRALGRKVSDEWTVPLCFLHHRALHDAGNEELWWRVHAIDAKAEAERLWRRNHDDHDPPLAASHGETAVLTPNRSAPPETAGSPGPEATTLMEQAPGDPAQDSGLADS